MAMSAIQGLVATYWQENVFVKISRHRLRDDVRIDR